MSLEARASLRQSKFSVLYLPILYPLFGLVLGASHIVVDGEEEGGEGSSVLIKLLL